MIEPRKPPPLPRGVLPLYRWKAFRDLIDYVVSMRVIVDSETGLEHEETPAGTRLWLSEPREFPIRITARSGDNYAWNAVKGTAGGGWTDLVRPAGTTTLDPAHEENGGVASVPQVVLGRREDWSKRVIFTRDLCT